MGVYSDIKNKKQPSPSGGGIYRQIKQQQEQEKNEFMSSIYKPLEMPKEETKKEVKMKVESKKVTTPIVNVSKMKDNFINEVTQSNKQNPVKPKAELPGRDIPVIGPVLRGLDFASEAAEPVANVLRQIVVPGAGLGSAARGLYGAAGGALEKYAPGLGKTLGGRVAREAIKEGAVGAPLGAGYELALSGDTKRAATAGALGAVGGAVLGGAAPLIGKAFTNTKLGKMFAQHKAIETPVQAMETQGNTLGLPAPKQRGNVNTAVTPDVIQPYGESVQFELPAPKIAEPTKARTGAKVNVYEQKLSRLFSEANKMDLPPGREREYMDDLWSRMASKDDPNLDTLIDLAYPSQKKLNPNLASMARENQRLREVYGVPNKVKSLNERMEPQGQLGIPAEPIERVGYKPLVTGSKVENKIANNPIQKTSKPKNIVDGEIVPSPIVSQLDNSIIPSAKGQLVSKYAAERAVIQQQPKPSQVSTAKPNERGFITTLRESEKTPESFKERLKSAYEPLTNQKVVDMANKRLNNDLESAASYVLGKSKFSAEKVTTAHRLIDEFIKQGNHERAVDIAEKIAEEGTRAGQTIQAFSIYNRLTPEGVLVHAKRVANKTNESIPVGVKEVEVTPQMAAQLTDLAATTQKMTGVKELSNTVIDILERAKAGTKLSREESDTLRKFVEESKQFVSEVEKKPRAPRPPKEIKDKRVRDNVVSFLDAQEAKAKERLRSRGIRISSTPLDVYADYAIIGASKLAKGTIKFSDWAEAMVKDLGEEVRPILENIYDKARETLDQSAKRISKSSISTAERITEKVIREKSLSEGEAESLRNLVIQVDNLSGDAKRIASQDLQAILQQLEKPTIGRKISSVQTIGQLLNTKTMVRNSLGNELFYRLERTNKLVATPIDWTRVKLFGGQRSVTFRTHNQGEYWKNWMRGLKAGWKGVNVDGLQTQYDLGPASFSAKWNPLTYLEKALGASLKSFDTAAYMRAVNDTIGEMATLRTINEGLTGEAKKAAIQKYIREVDDHVLRIADEYGKYVTLQDNNIISRGLVGLKRGLNFKQDFGVGDLVLKYPKTPGAIVMRALEYSPMGFLRSSMIALKPWTHKADPNTAEAMQALSRAIIGTLGLTGLGYFLADKGVITGATSKDRDIRDLQKSAGQGQYQVNLSSLKRWLKSNFDPAEAQIREGDQLYTYDWMQPVAIAASMGANISQSLKEKGSEGVTVQGLGKTAYTSLEGGLNTIVEQSVLQGIKKAAEGYPGQTVMDKINDILSTIPASFVPTVSNQVNQLMDNRRRETYDPNKLQQSLNKAKVKIPGLSQKLPQQYDTLGKPKQAYENNSAFNVLLNPGFASKYELTPEARMIIDLINETGDTSVAPRVPSKSINVKGEDGKTKNQKLTTEQFSKLQKYQGEKTTELLKRINPNSSTESKLKKVNSSLSKAGDQARKELKKELGVK